MYYMAKTFICCDMNQTDYLTLNALKSKLVEIYQAHASSTYSWANPSMTAVLGQLLLVESLEGFRGWQQKVILCRLSFADADGLEVQNNLLGDLDNLAKGASGATVIELMKWKKTMTEERWRDACKQNRGIIPKILKVCAAPSDAHVILFPCNEGLAALGNDADRLFELFGWQTGSVSTGSGDVSFLPVSEYGRMVLDSSKYSCKILDIPAVRMTSLSFNECQTAMCQQLFDSIRLLRSKPEDGNFLLTGDLSLSVPMPGYARLVTVRVGIDSKDRLYAVIDGHEKLLIADGCNWQLDNISMQILFAIGSKSGF